MRLLGFVTCLPVLVISVAVFFVYYSAVGAELYDAEALSDEEEILDDLQAQRLVQVLALELE